MSAYISYRKEHWHEDFEGLPRVSADALVVAAKIFAQDLAPYLQAGDNGDVHCPAGALHKMAVAIDRVQALGSEGYLAEKEQATAPDTPADDCLYDHMRECADCLNYFDRYDDRAQAEKMGLEGVERDALCPACKALREGDKLWALWNGCNGTFSDEIFYFKEDAEAEMRATPEMYEKVVPVRVVPEGIAPLWERRKEVSAGDVPLMDGNAEPAPDAPADRAGGVIQGDDIGNIHSGVK